MTSSTVSSESAFRSSANRAPLVIWSAFTDSFSSMIFFTLASISDMRFSSSLDSALRSARRNHTAITVDDLPRNVGRCIRNQEHHHIGHVHGLSETTQRNNLFHLRLCIFGKRIRHVCAD